MAEEQRERGRIRQCEGIDLALQNGTQFVRTPILVSEDFKEVYRKWKAEELTTMEAMQEAEVRKTCLYK